MLYLGQRGARSSGVPGAGALLLPGADAGSSPLPLPVPRALPESGCYTRLSATAARAAVPVVAAAVTTAAVMLA